MSNIYEIHEKIQFNDASTIISKNTFFSSHLPENFKNSFINEKTTSIYDHNNKLELENRLLHEENLNLKIKNKELECKYKYKYEALVEYIGRNEDLNQDSKV
jgi:hypothetical protein